MRRDAISSTYQQANRKIKKINKQSNATVKKSFDNIIDRIDVTSESNCFMKIKDYKENFFNHLNLSLINAANNKLGRISKTIFDNINWKLFEATKINQW